jgi:hypothetical protein
LTPTCCEGVLGLDTQHLDLPHGEALEVSFSPVTTTVSEYLADVPSASAPCIIISSFWPSWLQLLPFLTLHCEALYITTPACPWTIQWCRQWHLSPLPLTPETLLSSRLSDASSTPTVILAHGDALLYSSLPSRWWGRHPCLWLSAGAPTLTTPALPYEIELAALSCDCALDGSFIFRSNRPFAHTVSSPFRRRLRHVLNPATAVRPVLVAPVLPDADSLFDTAVWLPSPTETSAILHWGGGLPVDNPFAEIWCKSVYSKSKWTIRPLSISELCQIFEVPDYCIPTDLAPQVPATALPFIRSAPPKVLHHAAKTWSHLTNHPVIPLSQSTHTSHTTKSHISSYPSSYPLADPPEDFTQSYAHATKSDDAAVPTHFWDDRIWARTSATPSLRAAFESTYNHCALFTLRTWLLGRWRQNVTKSLCRYLRTTYGHAWSTSDEARRDVTVGIDCLSRAVAADWWEWKMGSTLFFWRWPEPLRAVARDGYPVWWLHPPHTNKRPQPAEKDPVVREKVSTKLAAVRARRYIVPGHVENLTSYFAVPKGDSDIRVVYDATKSGLNACMWVPSFSLPGAEAIVDMMDEDSFMMDLDLGEMFYNFPMHESVQAYCGLDLRPYFDPSSNKTMWERWCRCMMGWKPAPYFSTKYQLLADEITQGDPHRSDNPFGWNRVVLNLPGLASYDPTQPWVYRVTREGLKRNGGPTYVDDVRMIGTTLSACWAVAHKFATLLSYLGIQVASRKTRPPSKRPGAWAGIVATSGKEGIAVSVTMDKWLKAQLLLRDLTTELHTQSRLHHKTLERTRGFFNHLQRTYSSITPFLKGLHLTLDGWRPSRGPDLWPADESDDEGDSPTTVPLAAPPEFVTPAPRLADDLKVLSLMFAADRPTVRYVRASRIVVALYGFADASGSGFGSSIQLPNSRVQIRYGMWGRDVDDNSSNYRELRNLVDTVESSLSDLHESELFLFTDNSTAEAAYYRGNSSNKHLFELVVRLRLLDMTSNLRLHLLHIAGTRMIQQGTDAISRGSLPQALLSASWSSMVPLHLAAEARSPDLLLWCQTWIPAPGIQPLTPEEWYTRGHGWVGGTYNADKVWMPTNSTDAWLLWSPPPAAAQAAINELSLSRQKRTYINHVFICPRLCTHLWRKKLFKVADIVLEIPAGARPFWPASMHEPLLLGLTLRFTSVPPWQLRLSPGVLDLGRQMRHMWSNAAGDERLILQQLCNLPASLERL